MERGVIEPREAKEPLPFLPEWTCVIGPVRESGEGLLSRHLFVNRHSIDEFILQADGFTVHVLPKQARVLFDSRIVFHGNSASVNELLWFRRMEQQIASWDVNSRAAQCLWYGIGLKWATGQHGYRAYQDGRVTGESIA